jgi:hypothetical protein
MVAMVLGVGVASCDKAPGPERAEPLPAPARSPGFRAEGTERVDAKRGDSLRRLSDEEVHPPLQRLAVEVLRRYQNEPIGTDIRFNYEGQEYVARLEEHFGEPGTDGPAGEHKGVSLFIDEAPSREGRRD